MAYCERVPFVFPVRSWRWFFSDIYSENLVDPLELSHNTVWASQWLSLSEVFNSYTVYTEFPVITNSKLQCTISCPNTGSHRVFCLWFFYSGEPWPLYSSASQILGKQFTLVSPLSYRFKKSCFSHCLIFHLFSIGLVISKLIPCRYRNWHKHVLGFNLILFYIQRKNSGNYIMKMMYLTINLWKS